MKLDHESEVVVKVGSFYASERSSSNTKMQIKKVKVFIQKFQFWDFFDSAEEVWIPADDKMMIWVSMYFRVCLSN